MSRVVVVDVRVPDAVGALARLELERRAVGAVTEFLAALPPRR